MISRFKQPSFFRMVSRDRLSYAGFVLWVVGTASLVVLPILFRNMSTVGALVFATFPFCVGAVFIFPRMRLHRRLYREGRTAEGRVITKKDVTWPHRGSRIVYRYTYEEKEYEEEARTHWIVEDLQAGDEVAVLLNPEKPSQSLLPILYL
jgi:Protein of unknown function (DUF3592)